MVDRAWSATRLMSRRCYLAPFAPSIDVDHPTPNLPDALVDRDPTQEESESGRAHFAVVRTVAHQIEWLVLHHAGNRRAMLDWTGGGWSARWLAP
jgi:3-hydroxyisobutyrate dehydrogenase